jgi:P-type Ca2+ transporter type 2C
MRRVGAIAFTSDRKQMTVILESRRGVVAYTKGAPEVVLTQCSRIKLRDRVKR